MMSSKFKYIPQEFVYIDGIQKHCDGSVCSWDNNAINPWPYAKALSKKFS